MSSSTARRRHAAAGAAAGEWASVSGAGAWWVEEVGKHQLMRRTGFPPRDIRTLDLALSYPSSIMGRERVRAVITASEVLVPGPRDPVVAPLVRELRARLASTPTASPVPAPSPSPQNGEAGKDGSVSPPSRGGEGIGKDAKALGGDKALPFEIRALEVWLET